MPTTTRTQRRYDHRLRELVHETGDIDHAIRHGVPRSTARGWLKSVPSDVVTADVFEASACDLEREVIVLRQRVEQLSALLRLLVVLVKVCSASLRTRRVPNGCRKVTLLRAIERSRSALPVRIALRVLGLSESRYHSWKREDECELDDVDSCPRSTPGRLTREELATIEEMVTSDECRHVPTGTLALLAQRLGKVFASASTWYRLVRRYKWRRPRRRVHPQKPKIGIRAARPNEIWHVDTTLIRLLDGTRAYTYAVIDNYSRKILAWKVSAKFEAAATAELLLDASRGLVEAVPKVLADGGVENFNSCVDELVDSGILRRLLAMTDVSFSNSLIESWWRSLKHQWLFLNPLDSVAAVERLTAFYVREHNTELPHSAFRGQTPDEMYFGTGDHVPDDLEAKRGEARARRMASNRAAACSVCEPMGVGDE